MSSTTQSIVDPALAEERAFKASVTATPQHMTTLLIDAIGARVTAAALGLSDARPLYEWRTGGARPRAHAAQQRLRTLFRVATYLGEAYSPEVAAAWLQSTNPLLDDVAPLVVLADYDPDDAAPKVVAAARALVEG